MFSLSHLCFFNKNIDHQLPPSTTNNSSIILLHYEGDWKDDKMNSDFGIGLFLKITIFDHLFDMISKK